MQDRKHKPIDAKMRSLLHLPSAGRLDEPVPVPAID